MTTNDIISDAGNKFFPKTSRHATKVDQIILETEWTDYLQQLVDYGNSNYLKNFSLKLELEDD